LQNVSAQIGAGCVPGIMESARCGLREDRPHRPLGSPGFAALEDDPPFCLHLADLGRNCDRVTSSLCPLQSRVSVFEQGAVFVPAREPSIAPRAGAVKAQTSRLACGWLGVARLR